MKTPFTFTKWTASSLLPVTLALSLMPYRASHASDIFLRSTRQHTTLTSTIPGNGDVNPYAIVVAPVSAGTIQQNDVLVDNFNNDANLQGLGTTIVDYNPYTKKTTQFASIPRHLAGCPGGVGLTTAMTMLKMGWIIVGSLPSNDGTTRTKGPGCLIVLNASGQVMGTIAGPNINGPWGNMAVVDNGDTATLFVSNTGFGVGAPTDNGPVINESTVLRMSLSIPPAKPPIVTNETVVGDSYGEQADKGVFIIGPTGLVYDPNNGTLYVSNANGNEINAIPDAMTRTTSAGTGLVVTGDGFIQRPLAMAMAPDGHLLVTNALNGEVVEIDPVTRKQIAAQWIDVDKAQSPPGNGDLFGIAMTPEGHGFYYVEDDVNTLALAN